MSIGRQIGWGVAGIAAAAGLVFLLVRTFPATTSTSDEVQRDWSKLAASAVMAIKAGSLDEAYDLQDRAMALVTPAKPGDVRPAQTCALLGEIHNSAGKPELAEQAFHDAVLAGRKAVGPDDPALIEILDSLANFYYYRGEFDEVVPIYRRILRIVERAPAMPPRELANRSRNLAGLYQALDRFDEAEPLYERALAAGEKAGPIYRSEWIHDMMTVAAFYRDWGKYPQAEALAERALGLAEKDLGTDSMDAAIGLDALGRVQLAASKPELAEPLFARALAIAERHVGPDSSDLAPRLAALAAAELVLHKFELADAHFERALAVTERDLGPECPEIVTLLEEYAALLDEAGRPAEAAARRKQADLILHPPVLEPTLAE